jgi:hypothetical protein
VTNAAETVTKEAAPRSRRRLARLSTTPDSPFEVITLGGQVFTRTSFNVRQDEMGDTQRSEIRGTVCWISDEQIAAVKAAARKRVVRMGGAQTDEEQDALPEGQRGKGRPSIFMLGSRRYTPIRGDKPIAQFVTISFLQPGENPHGQQALPGEKVGPTLADELAGEDKSAVDSAPKTAPKK